MVTLNHTADITHEGKNCLTIVTNLDGVSTWACHFRQLNFDVREAIALAEDLPDGAEDTLEITWRMIDASSENASGIGSLDLMSLRDTISPHHDPSILLPIVSLRHRG